MKVLATAYCVWLLVAIVGCFGVYGNGLIWSDGWSFADGDDVVFVCWLVGSVPLGIASFRELARV